MSDHKACVERARAIRAVVAETELERLRSQGGFVGKKWFVVPKGAPVFYRGAWKPAGRKQIIDLDRPERQAVRYGDEWVIVTWPGTGGYWRHVVQYRGEFVARMP